MTTEQRHDLLRQRRERYEEETYHARRNREAAEEREQRPEARRARERCQCVVAAEKGS